MRRNRETVLVRRNVQVELVPAGTPVELEEGTWCEITQALGSSFTLLVEGQLVRLRGSDADAIGKKDPTPVVEHGDVEAAAGVAGAQRLDEAVRDHPAADDDDVCHALRVFRHHWSP